MITERSRLMNFGPNGPDYPDATYVEHAYPEALFDTGEVALNYAATGSAGKSALLLVPPQASSSSPAGSGARSSWPATPPAA
jgi:hypothetical protein